MPYLELGCGALLCLVLLAAPVAVAVLTGESAAVLVLFDDLADLLLERNL
ncbi:hypothetical protein [Nonomuraea sp. NPDC052265]